MALTRNPNTSSTVAIGDVGYIRGGKFYRLFAATSSVEELGHDAPSGFEPLVVPESLIDTMTRKSYPLHTRNITLNGANARASLNTS